MPVPGDVGLYDIQTTLPGLVSPTSAGLDALMEFGPDGIEAILQQARRAGDAVHLRPRRACVVPLPAVDEHGRYHGEYPANIHPRVQAEEMEDEVPPPRPGAQPILEWEVRSGRSCAARACRIAWRAGALPPGSGAGLRNHRENSAEQAVVSAYSWGDPTAESSGPCQFTERQGKITAACQLPIPFVDSMVRAAGAHGAGHVGQLGPPGQPQGRVPRVSAGPAARDGPLRRRPAAHRAGLRSPVSVLCLPWRIGIAKATVDSQWLC